MVINSNNQLQAGEMLAIEGEKPEAAYMVLKGKVRLFGNSFSTIVGAGSLLFAEDYVNGAYSFCASAEEETVVYAFASESPTLLEDFVGQHRECSGPAVYSQIKIINELEKQYFQLSEIADKLYGFLHENYPIYINEARQAGCRPELIPEISRLETREEISAPEEMSFDIYHEYAAMPYEILKNYYNASTLLTVKVLHEMYGVTEVMSDVCNELSDYIAGMYELLYGDIEESLYRNFLLLDLDAKKNGLPTPVAMEIAEKCRELGKETEEFFRTRTGRELCTESDTVFLAEMREKALNGIDIRGNKRVHIMEEIDVTAEMNSLRGSYEQIIKFAHYPDEAAEELKGLLEQYEGLLDRESSDDRLKLLRRGLTEHFYALYGQTLGKTLGAKKKPPKAVELFLDYGYLSEKLLEQGQLEQLLQITPVTFNEPCGVYTMRQWLTAVFRGEKEPSRNDLGQDYTEVLRDLRKQGRISEEKEKELQTNSAMKLDYEIKNVFGKVNRIVNGQLSTFVPILHSEQLLGEVLRAYNSAKQINETVLELSRLDYTVFYREAMYARPELGIEREVIQREVFPDIILCPTVASNVIMWQEITGRKRDTKGRFFTGILTFSDLRDMMIKALGEFRWALCKTIQGANWNNIQYESLTADYSDYIQFFRKNKDLSEEKREKLKLQIQRGRNSLSRIFAMDYELWMKSEAIGSVRLNKVAREIMATYCPFCASVRNNLVRQPMFEEAFQKNSRERTRKVHELEIRYRSLEKNGVTLPAELKNTMRFYKEL